MTTISFCFFVTYNYLNWCSNLKYTPKIIILIFKFFRKPHGNIFHDYLLLYFDVRISFHKLQDYDDYLLLYTQNQQSL